MSTLSPAKPLTLEAATRALPSLHAWMRADAAYSALVAHEPPLARVDRLLQAARASVPDGLTLLAGDIDDAREHVRGELTRYTVAVLDADAARGQAKNWLHHAGVNIWRGDHHAMLCEAAESEPDGGAAVAAFLASWMDYITET